MPNAPLQTMDFWRVNSYGYPNFFSSESKAQEAWITLCSFFDHEDGSYSDLKEYWRSSHAPRRLDNHAVESWKATFEEFGLIYVISRSDRVSVTPAGVQFREAAQENNRDEFVWVGLNLLFRYPLQGPPRGRPKSPAHDQSDLLLYRFLYSAMRDLGDYFWWTELERILCRVFSTAEASPAVEAVKAIREDVHRYTSFELPTDRRRGAFYNSLNQVANHAGMNHLVLNQDDESEHYGASESRRRHLINRNYLSLVCAALGDGASAAECRASALYVDRLPRAPRITDEQEYFDYLGARVPTLAGRGDSTPQTVTLAGDTVFVLKQAEHFSNVSSGHQERAVDGRASVLCRVARNHRVILSDDLSWTYLVVEKTLVGSNTVRLSLRRARPISNVGPIQELLGDDDA
jgi:hypothetical protein